MKESKLAPVGQRTEAEIAEGEAVRDLDRAAESEKLALEAELDAEIPNDPPVLLEGDDAALAAARAEDHALIRRAQTGDEQAFAELVTRHQQRACRVARNLVASDEDAQDLAQEAFLRVFRNLANFDFQHGFTTWLYRIVTNLAIDHLRKRRPTKSTARLDEDEGELDLPDVDGERPSDGLERDELAREVRDCLAALAPHFQSVLVLREMEGLPCNEIAHIVGATHVTVRWRLHRGRKLFQEEWERRARLAQVRGGQAFYFGPHANNGAESDVDAAQDEGEEGPE